LNKIDKPEATNFEKIAFDILKKPLFSMLSDLKVELWMLHLVQRIKKTSTNI